MITYTGLVTLVFTLMPWAVSANFKSLDAYFEAAYPARAEIIDIGHALRSIPIWMLRVWPLAV